MSLLVVYNVEMSIDTTPTSGTATYAALEDGWNNITESLNEVVQQYWFLGGEGFATNYVTGMAPVFTLTGVRILGDTAQDYIFSNTNKYGLLANRETKLQIKRTVDSTTTTITVPVTLCNMTDLGGGSTDGSAVSVEIRFNGKPTIS